MTPCKRHTHVHLQLQQSHSRHHRADQCHTPTTPLRPRHFPLSTGPILHPLDDTINRSTRSITTTIRTHTLAGLITRMTGVRTLYKESTISTAAVGWQ